MRKAREGSQALPRRHPPLRLRVGARGLSRSVACASFDKQSLQDEGQTGCSTQATRLSIPCTCTRALAGLLERHLPCVPSGLILS
jgi:hypothetical protein